MAAQIAGADRARLAAGLRQRYEAGETQAQLAASTGRSDVTVRKLLREAGTLIRHPGPAAQQRGTCSINDEGGKCPNPVFVLSHGWCHKHYRRWRDHGDPLVVLPGPVKYYGEEAAALASWLKQEYEAGKSAPSLAAAIGHSAGLVTRLIEQAGGRMRQPGAQPTYDGELEAWVLGERAKGRSKSAIAADLGRSVTFIRKMLERNGEHTRDREGAAFRGLNEFTELNRQLWAAAHPGEPNPFFCHAPVTPHCENLADPSRNFLCGTHRQRFRETGTFERAPCRRCGNPLNTSAGTYLCAECRQQWRYCSYPEHEGERIMPLNAFPLSGGRTRAWCGECWLLHTRKNANCRKCQRCGDWLKTKAPKRTLCAACWEGVPGCAERSGECSQPVNRLINGLCLTHYHRARRRTDRDAAAGRRHARLRSRPSDPRPLC